MRHNLFTLAILAALLAITSCSDDDVVGSGPSVSRTFELANFDQLDIEGSFDVNIQQGDSVQVTATGQANIIDIINTAVTDNRWTLRYTENNVKSDDLSINITVPFLSEISSDGSTDVTLGSFTDQASLLISIDGSGEYDVTGQWADLEALTLSINGSGEVDGFPLEAKDVRVDIEGSGEVDVTAIETLDITIAGSGTVRYKGSPMITQSISGSGEIIDAN